VSWKFQSEGILLGSRIYIERTKRTVVVVTEKCEQFDMDDLDKDNCTSYFWPSPDPSNARNDPYDR